MTDIEKVEIELTDNEKRALAYQGAGVPNSEIAARLKVTRQGAYEILRSGERKQWRLLAKERHAGHLHDCPIAELPLPSRIRGSLIDAGYIKVGDIAHKTREELGLISGIGQRHGSFVVYKLLQSWFAKKPSSFCPNCGAGLKKKLREGENEVNCSRCGRSAVLQIEPEALATA